jgi:hypothetical protein
MKRIAVVLAALGLAAPAAQAATAGTAYHGKTKAGTTIRFSLSGRAVSGLVTSVPVVCLETSGTYQNRGGIELFKPPAFALGNSVQTKALQPSIMNNGNKVTKTYTITAAKSGGKVSGKLRISFSFLRPGGRRRRSVASST